MNLPRIAILGAGPAGLGAAWQLHKHAKGQAVVLERCDDVGGNAGGLNLDGVYADFGSHRLHPATDPRILRDIKELLGDDFLDRPRHGRIRLRGRWIHFPLKPVDLALRLPPTFALGVGFDAVAKMVPRATNHAPENFATILQRGLGRTICRDFYFPYAVKMWGLPPEELSATQARRRVAAGSLGKMVRKVLSIVPGMRSPGAGRFYYPRYGFGQISRAIADAARAAGADLRLNTTVRRVTLGTPHRLELECHGNVTRIEADHVWSTVPIALLPRLIDPPAPPEVQQAAAHNESRAMLLIYLVLGTPQFTPFDAHYFPEADIKLTRLSEPKNYSGSTVPADRTVLCGELPCTTEDAVWTATDAELTEVMRDALARCGIPITAPILRTVVRRLPHAYPVYRAGYEQHFRPLDEWAGNLDRFLTFGRQGLFAHDNTHHALAMAYAAVECLDHQGRFDHDRWAACREEFTHHVVED